MNRSERTQAAVEFRERADIQFALAERYREAGDGEKYAAALAEATMLTARAVVFAVRGELK